MKFYIKAVSSKTSRSKVESFLCEERVPALLLNLNYLKEKAGNVNLTKSSARIAPCDGLLLKQTTRKIYTACPHSMNVAIPCLPHPSYERLHLEHYLIPRKVLPKRTRTCLLRRHSSFSSGRNPLPGCS
jgi:hypothetical protein